ncbi:hypothetical protein ACJ73_07142 [Blastomyces percursus]|uniref:SRP9 domain-containing protein n=1 Tax=Blastomyces percursus TaxID=1658174 RepID=A0A1J9PYX4_9EURO|nr:hypothetical protein ACJ73_07142 [Blastomyces percursus]
MPYLPTSQEYLEQSALLLQAYPDTTRITTKYSYPRPKKSSAQPTSTKPKPATTDASTPSTQARAQSQSQSQTSTPSTLTLKTFHPTSGICLKYRTNKAAEVGRLIAGLGKLASGAPVVERIAADAGMTGDTEMVDAPPPTSAPASAATSGPGAGAGAGGKGSSSGGGGGGKSKKKGKGKK